MDAFLLAGGVYRRVRRSCSCWLSALPAVSDTRGGVTLDCDPCGLKAPSVRREIISLQFLGQREHVKMTGKITDLLEDRISLLGFPQFPLRQILGKQFAHFRINLRFHPLKERTNDKVSAFILNAKS